jgi:endonuclease/exonuclease/phosphatase family metal-dependent hydrolase
VKLLVMWKYLLTCITNSLFVCHQSSSDVILLQEWWFDEKFTEVFDGILGGQFDRVAERRPASINNSVYTYLQQSHDLNIIRDDGMACLVNKKGKLKLVSSSKVLTGPERIAQIIHCKERDDTSSGRDVFIANTHLSFPKDEDQNKNDRRQAYEINLIQRALSKMSRSRDNEALELICGDFNSEPNGLASTQLELRDFLNCASIKGEQLGVTHHAHTGQEISADHIFVRQARMDQYEKQGDEVTFDRSVFTSRRKSLSIGYQDPLSLGCIDTRGTQVINIRREDIRIKGRGVLSDHRPVTATLRWPKFRSVGELSDPFVNFSNSTMPLDPLSLCASEL